MMRREDYKAVKHMDKAQMERYLQTIYRRGFDAGIKAAIAQKVREKPKPDEAVGEAAEV